MRERTSLWMEKESGIKSVAFMQGTFNCKVNRKFIKYVSNVHDTSFELYCRTLISVECMLKNVSCKAVT